MASGDLAFHSEIIAEVNHTVQQLVQANPTIWLNIKDVVDLYVKERAKARLKRAETSILFPLNLDRDSFLSTQKIMDSDLVNKIAQELISFEIPDVSTIIMGVDRANGNNLPHIYTIHNEYVSCDDVIGFSAIGSGSRHAVSQFMLARHAWNRDVPETLLLTYSAKKDSEIAPGVGSETDMFMMGPNLGQSVEIRVEAMQKLEKEYLALKKKQHKAQESTRGEMQRYVDNLSQQAATAQETTPTAGQEGALDGSATSEPS